MKHHALTICLFLGALIMMPARTSAATTWKIMCIGDSITQGPYNQLGQITKQDSYRWSLGQYITGGGYFFHFIGRRIHPFGGTSNKDFLHPTGWDYYHEGWAGKTSLDLIDPAGDHPNDWKPGLKRNKIFPTAASVSTKGIPDIVLLHIGTNDNTRSSMLGNDPVSGIAYKDLHTLASTMQNVVILINYRLRIANPRVKILLAKLIPTRLVDRNDGISCIGIQNINAAYVQLAQQYSTSTSPIIVVDQYTGYDALTYNYDDLHPNPIGESVIAAKWYEKLQLILSGSYGDTTPPSIPRDLMISGVSTNSVALTWAASTDNLAVAHYDVLRDGVVVATVTTTTWTNSGLVSGVTYTYAIVARDAAGNVSSQSTPVPVTTLGDVTPPSIPTDVASSSLSSTSVTLNWSASTDNIAGPITYDVYRNSGLIASINALSYTDAALSPLTTYVYTLKARDAADNASDFSPPLTITTVEPVTGPTFLMGINMNGGSVTIDGRAWKTYDAALSSGFTISSPTGILKATSAQIPVPAPQDADVTPMLGTVVYATATMTMNQTLPNGKYSVYLWMMENYKNYFRKINVSMESTLVASNLCYVTLGTWNRYGPYTVTVNDSALTITMTRSGTTGNPGLMGLEIWNAANISGVATRIWHIMGASDSIRQGIADHNSYRKVLIDLLVGAGYPIDMVGI